MAVICVTSLRQGEGKTALSSGLARLLTGQGRAVHAFNPLRVTDDEGRDSAFLASMSGSTPPSGWPLTASGRQPAQRYRPSNFQRFCARPRHDNRSSLPCSMREQDAAPLVQSLADALDARVFLVARYSPDIAVEQIVEAAGGFGDRLAGVVLNRVFKYRAQDAQARLAEGLRSQNIPVRGAPS